MHAYPRVLRSCTGAGLLLLATAGVLLLLGAGEPAGYAAAVGFACLGVGFQASMALRTYAYTCAILAAVALALTAPDVFRRIGDFELQQLIVPLLQVIMFGMGAQLSHRDFLRVARQPTGLAVGLVCQFSIMPLVGFTLAHVTPFPAEVAAGILLVGCAPSGLASNVMTFIARGNLALSVALTLVATVVSPVATPALMKILGGEFIAIDFWNMMLSITSMVILPVVAGLAFNAVAYGREPWRRVAGLLTFYAVVVAAKNAVFHFTGSTGPAATARSALVDTTWFVLLPVLLGWLIHRTAGGSRPLIDRITATCSMAGIAVIISIITAVGRDNLLTPASHSGMGWRGFWA